MIRFSLRLPDNLHTQVKQQADQEQRSMNDQMIVMLREGIARRELDKKEAKGEVKK